MKFWLSFADSNRSEGQQFLGACCIEVPTIEDPRAQFLAAVLRHLGS